MDNSYIQDRFAMFWSSKLKKWNQINPKKEQKNANFLSSRLNLALLIRKETQNLANEWISNHCHLSSYLKLQKRSISCILTWLKSYQKDISYQVAGLESKFQMLGRKNNNLHWLKHGCRNYPTVVAIHCSLCTKWRSLLSKFISYRVTAIYD